MEFLEQLETRDLHVTSKVPVPEPSNNSINTQEATHRILQLRRQRDALKSELKLVETMITDNCVSVEDSSDEAIEDETEELTLVKNQHQQLSVVLECLRLTGFTVFSVDSTNIIFSYDTSHKGFSHETFYLEIQDLQNEKFKVMRHSFPCFIPVLELEQTFLKVDPRQFLLKLSDYLFAYITRREEVNIIKENFKDKVLLTRSEPVDFVEIKIGQQNDILQLEFQLTYTDLLHTMPTKTRLTVIVNDDSEGYRIKPKEKLVNKWKNDLQKQLLTGALSDIISDYEKLLTNCNQE